MPQFRVLAFGVFDGIHPGHLAFLEQAKRLGSELVVVVTRDAAVAREKGRRPRILLRERVQLVAALRVVDRAVAGDPSKQYGACLKRLKPDVIAVGYDQRWDPIAFSQRLAALGLSKTRVVRFKAYRGRTYHTSRLA